MKGVTDVTYVAKR